MCKQQTRQELNAAVAAFQARGGQVQTIAFRKSPRISGQEWRERCQGTFGGPPVARR